MSKTPELWQAVIDNDLEKVRELLISENKWFAVNSVQANKSTTAKLSTKYGNIEIDPYRVNLQAYQATLPELDNTASKIAEELARDAFGKISGATQTTKFTVARSIMYAAIRWLQKGYPQTARTLFSLLIQSGALDLDIIVLPGEYDLLRIFFKMYPEHTYTVSKVVYDWITARPRSFAEMLLTLIGDEPTAADITRLFQIWLTFGDGPSPFQFRQIFKYKKTFDAKQRLAILKILNELGYDFNRKYISHVSNEPLYYSLADLAASEKEIRKEIIELIVHGRLDTRGLPPNLFPNKKIQSAINAYEYVWKTKISEICQKQDLDFYQKQAKKYRLEKLAYQLQLRKAEEDVCGCLKSTIKAQKEKVYPFEKLTELREKRECDNEQTPFSLEDTTEFSDEQLLEYTEKTDRGQRKYCYDRASKKLLLQKPTNPYTNREFSEEFLDDLARDQKTYPEELALTDAVEELTDTGAIAAREPESDLRQTLQQLTNRLSKINPYLDYEKWATGYAKKDYNAINQDVGFKYGLVSVLGLGDVKITLPRDKYITQLMATILNRLDNKNITPEAATTVIATMLEYVPSSIAEMPVGPEESKEELKEKKQKLLKDLVAGGFTDQSLIKQLLEVRDKLKFGE